MKPLRLSMLLLGCLCLCLISLSPAVANTAHPTLSLGSLKQRLGNDWIIEQIPNGYLLTSLRPVVFLPNVSVSSKKNFNQQVATARRDFLRIKIVRGAPLTHDNICDLSVIDYVLPEVQHQASLGYYPCWDISFDAQIEFYDSHRNEPFYLLSNSRPDENTYPSDVSEQFDYAVETAYTLSGFDMLAFLSIE